MTDVPQTPALRRPARPGMPDAVRATVGVVVAFAGALLIGGLIGLLAGDLWAGEEHTAGASRAQLAVQAVAFAAAALVLIDGLRLAERPGDPRGLSIRAARFSAPALPVLAVGLVAAGAAHFVGPIVAALAPHLNDPAVPVGSLGVGSGVGADLGTVVVVVGLIPLGEELLFRGVLTTAWLRAGRPGIAVASSTVLFGLAHVTVGPRTMVVAAALGALFAIALQLSGSLGAPVLAHTIVNAVALLQAGLHGAAPVALLAATVIVTTVAATRLSPVLHGALVRSRPAPGDTLSP